MSHRTLDMREHVLKAPGPFSLGDYDPGATPGISHSDAKDAQAELEQRLRQQQELLYGAATQSVLIILQGMDTSGKDGTVKHVMNGVNPVGCHVWDFKVPTTDEQAHDFLWRIHKRTPARGMMAIFNRSQYEDVLVARVHHLVPREVWMDRYEQINNFERMLTRNNTIILKFFLYISSDEQRDRLIKREKDPDKAWKLSVGDWKERAYWDDYTRAYEDALGQCSTAWAPWYIAPANHKWYRNYFVARSIVDRLAEYEPAWEQALAEMGTRRLAELHAAHVHDDDHGDSGGTDATSGKNGKHHDDQAGG